MLSQQLPCLWVGQEGSNKLGEPTNASPAFSNGEIFIRTSQHLYCLARKK